MESKLLQCYQLRRNFEGGGGDNLGWPQLVLSSFIAKFQGFSHPNLLWTVEGLFLFVKNFVAASLFLPRAIERFSSLRHKSTRALNRPPEFLITQPRGKPEHGRHLFISFWRLYFPRYISCLIYLQLAIVPFWFGGSRHGWGAVPRINRPLTISSSILLGVRFFTFPSTLACVALRSLIASTVALAGRVSFGVFPHAACGFTFWGVMAYIQKRCRSLFLLVTREPSSLMCESSSPSSVVFYKFLRFFNSWSKYIFYIIFFAIGVRGFVNHAHICYFG